MVEKIAEAIQLISLTSENDVKSAFATAFESPAPLVSADDVASFTSAWRSPETQLWLESVLGPELPSKPYDIPRVKYRQYVHTYPDGTKAGFDIFEPFPNKLGPCKSLERALMQAYLEKALPKGEAEKFLMIDIEKIFAEQERVLKAVKKIGITEKAADPLVEDALRSALTRLRVKTAVVNGVWQSALLTGVFDIMLLFDGNFKQYLIKIGISGLYGGTVGGLSQWINHPFFGNGVVLGVLVGSAFGAISLASTGDWARFGKNLGISIIGGAAAWGGGAAGGAMVCAMGGGPLGMTIGIFVGGLAGGSLGRQVALEIPGLGGMTEHEVKTMYATIKEQLTRAGMEPDPSLSPEQVVADILKHGNKGNGLPFQVRMTESHAADVTELRDALLAMRSRSPEAFDKFLNLLRAASKT
ncbi:hypothetical protein SLS56_000960 [Neofusicoccum ribis]|uniref:Uncharacterized protein n=1 Tax=Neofusicoccum ribis TaxID=45134 RepID=A0ABR3TBX0_9PEZI